MNGTEWNEVCVEPKNDQQRRMDDDDTIHDNIFYNN
jgi:hypothetical protein